MNPVAWARRLAALAVVATAFLLAGCGAPPTVSPVARASSPRSLLDGSLEQAVAAASEGLLVQARRLPAFRSASGRRSAVLDPMLDASTGQQTAATLRIGRHVAERLAAGPDAIDWLAFRPPNVAIARFVLTGSLSRALPDQPKGAVLLNLALTEQSTGLVAAQAWALAHDDPFDASPLPHDADSPLPVRDAAVDGYLTTSATGAGKPADPAYLNRIPVAPLLDDANQRYDAGSYAEALAGYRHVAAAGSPPLRALVGIYLANVRLGRHGDAEQAFGSIVAHGLAIRQFDVRFLFAPAGTAFASDPTVSGPYPMWLRQIARETAAAKACLTLVGHASRTGSDAANDTLSLQRATVVRQRLVAEAAALGERIKVLGAGSRNNLVGNGSDDATDALDRRVDIRVVPCTPR